MRRSAALMLGLALLVPAITGCLGYGSEETTDQGLDTKSKATVTSQDGGVEGVVTDSAVQPIADATVTLEETGASTTTADDGSFAFSEVPPSAYTLNVTKDGFISTERTIDVRAGEVSTVEILIAHEPTIKPYMAQLEFSGFMECSVGLAGGAFIFSQNTCSEATPSGATNTKTTFYYDLEPNAWQIVTEVTWDGSATGDQFWMNSETRGFSNAWHVAYADEVATSPIISTTDRAKLTQITKNFTAICNGEMSPRTTSNQPADAYCNHDPVEKGAEVGISVATQTASQATVDTPDPLFPIGAGAAVQQDFQVYQTVFYNAPACEDFSIVEENECQQMQTVPAEDPYDEISGGSDTAEDQR